MGNNWIIQQDEEINKADRIDTVSLEYDIMKARTMRNGLNYVVLDAAQWGFDIEDACTRNPEYRLLFATRGIDKNLNTVSPYLFTYEKGSVFAKWLDKNRDDSHGILYIYSKLTIEELRRHLRRFLRIKSENGKWFLFRYYDPIVAQSIFSHLTSEQKAVFFSKIEYIAFHDVYDDTLTTAAKNVETYKYAITNNIPIGSAFRLTDAQVVSMNKTIFENKAINRLSGYPESRSYKREEFYNFVRTKIIEAEKYNITEEYSIYCFLLLAVKHSIMKNSRYPDNILNVLQSNHTNSDKIEKLHQILLTYQKF